MPPPIGSWLQLIPNDTLSGPITGVTIIRGTWASVLWSVNISTDEPVIVPEKFVPRLHEPYPWVWPLSTTARTRPISRTREGAGRVIETVAHVRNASSVGLQPFKE